MKPSHPAAHRYALDLARFGIESDESNLARAYLELREKVATRAGDAIERIDLMLNEMLEAKEDGVAKAPQFGPRLIKAPRELPGDVVIIDTEEKFREYFGTPMPEWMKQPPMVVKIQDAEERDE